MLGGLRLYTIFCFTSRMNYVTEVNSFCVSCTIKAKKSGQKNTAISDSATTYGLDMRIVRDHLKRQKEECVF